VGTEKRERQKANRQQRLVEEARAERAGVVKRNALRWTIAIAAAIGAVVLIAWVGGAFDSDDDDLAETDVTLPPVEAAPQDTTPVDTTPVDTTPPVTFPALPKPEVEIPAEPPTELVVTVLEPGDGPEAAEGDVVTVNYVGVRTADGTEFDDNYDGAPFNVVLGAGGVIEGWEQGLLGVQAGSRVQLDIPADLAYGDNPPGDPIQPGDALTFVVDVRSVEAVSN
jgi:peptidylprolyl isomerase